MKRHYIQYTIFKDFKNEGRRGDYTAQKIMNDSFGMGMVVYVYNPNYLVDGESWFKVKPGKKVSETLFQRTSKVW